jgi:dipeptidyl aminopeptidase/acylaminoacyl peptidase
MNHRTLRHLLICVATPVLFAQSPTQRLLQVDDMQRIHDVRDVQISPDGAWVAYTVSSVDVAADKSDSDVWMASWDGSRQVRLTSSPESESAPRWSPDGRYLAFLSSRPGKAKGAQVWLLDRSGGEAQQLTDIKGKLSSYEWSPDSKRLVLVVQDRDPDDPDDDKPATSGQGTGKAPKPIVIDRYKFKEDIVGYLTQHPGRLFLFDIASKKTDPLTGEDVESASPSWSPDGKSIAFLGKRGKDAERYNIWDVFAIESKAGAAPRQLTHYDGVHASASRARPEWSPDGTRLVYLQTVGARLDQYNQNRIAVIAASGGEPRVLAEKLDRPAFAPRFSKDGSSILFLAADDRRQYPATVPANDGAVEKLLDDPLVVSALAQGKDGRLAVVAATDQRPNEVQVLENGKLRALTHHNDALMAELKLGTTEDFSCKTSDGTEVHGLIVKPADYQPGRKYPTLLRIHGGPNGQDAHAFNFEHQIFAANGYVVVAVNYRGSSGRGDAYQTAIAADWGDKEVIDLKAAVDYVLSIGLADPDRLGVGGWSYGGILTDAMIAKDHRFKAATSGAGTAFPLSMYGHDQYVMQYNEEIGAPWKVGLEPWMKISYGFLHADQITTPTLFLGGEKDSNVPLIGGEQMYEALRTLGVPTELVIYPGQFHGITRPSYQKDRIERYLAWYAKYLKPAAAPVTTTAAAR